MFWKYLELRIKKLYSKPFKIIRYRNHACIHFSPDHNDLQRFIHFSQSTDDVKKSFEPEEFSSEKNFSYELKINKDIVLKKMIEDLRFLMTKHADCFDNRTRLITTSERMDESGDGCI